MLLWDGPHFNRLFVGYAVSPRTLVLELEMSVQLQRDLQPDCFRPEFPRLAARLIAPTSSLRLQAATS